MNGFLDAWLLRLPRPEQLGPLLDGSELDAREQARGRSFTRPHDGVLYVSAHIALRRVLGHYLGLAPDRVPFVREPCPGCGGPHGRPAVAHPDPPLHFSLSHSSGMVLVAVASETVGADVERRPRPGTVEVCTRSLHPAERAEIEDVPPPGRCAAFGRVWTRKEAYLKALGTGLSRSPAADYLGADAARRPPGWSVLDLDCGPHHDGAVAYRGAADAPRAVHRLPAAVLLPGGASVPAGTGAPAPLPAG
ncbi:4'-phosphopantetheinyl transferase superfamily protein [Streptomyces sp. NPDC042319]|uniref:4'-phosphopantetheinyl transferase family protein n=1 Tax=Streptomyces sp. NPDC042319 TaxID=3154332 RepID=UPI00340D5B01